MPLFNEVDRALAARVAIAAIALIALPGFGVRALDDSSTGAFPKPPARTAASVGSSRRASSAAAKVRTAGSELDSMSLASWDDVEIGRVDPTVFELALGAARCAIRSGAVDEPATLTVIDYSRPSTGRRLWVYDIQQRRLLFEELVAHGRGSGANFATRFSNQPDSHRTSLGLYVTGTTYVGRNGYSLRLEGLDEGFNDRARERAIVMHGAPYVSQAFARTHGRIGRSWGCPAVSDAVARDVIDAVKGGGLVFAYYPDQNWLRSSRYLTGC
jgi:hypothetical protein